MEGKTTSLLRVLDEAGFAYATRKSSAGTPYAGFRWESPESHRERSFTALLESEVLRLTLHEPLGRGGTISAFECLARQRDFPVARLYGADDRKARLELTAAVSVHGTELVADTLTSLLSHLAANADDLLGSASGASRCVPPLQGNTEEFSIPEVLRLLGFHPSRDRGAYTVNIPLPGLAQAGHFLVYHLGPGWVRVTACLHDNNALSLDGLTGELVNQLQIWAPVGRFVSIEQRDELHLGCEVAAPLLSRSATDVVADSMRAAIRLLGTAYKQAQQVAGRERKLR